MKPHIDTYAILLYLSGLGGITGAISLEPGNQTLKVVLAVLGAVSFMAGLAARTFYNPTNGPQPGPPVPPKEP